MPVLYLFRLSYSSVAYFGCFAMIMLAIFL
jgi:hypothetical protein